MEDDQLRIGEEAGGGFQRQARGRGKIGRHQDARVGSAGALAHHQQRLRQVAGHLLHGRAEQDFAQGIDARITNDDEFAVGLRGCRQDGVGHVAVCKLQADGKAGVLEFAGDVAPRDEFRFGARFAAGQPLHDFRRHLRTFAHRQQRQLRIPLRRQRLGALERTVATRTQIGGEQQLPWL